MTEYRLESYKIPSFFVEHGGERMPEHVWRSVRDSCAFGISFKHAPAVLGDAGFTGCRAENILARPVQFLQ